MGRQLLTSGALVLIWAAGDPQAAALRHPVAEAFSSAGAQARRPPARMRFEVMDRNGDREISREEWRGSARSFQVHDWNGDGRLAGDEVAIDRRQDVDVEQADHVPSSAERFLSWTERGFGNLDHNRDRRITSDEWHYDRETFLRVDRNRDGALDAIEFVGADMDDDRGDRFDDLDADRNGRVERDEWHASEDAFAWLDRNRDGTLSRAEVVGEQDPAPRDQFTSLDMDRSGRITRDEWHWSGASFDGRDRNRDGALTPAEFGSMAGEADRSAGGTGGTVPVTVDARTRWTDTGIQVRAGDRVMLSARGSIQMSNDANDTATPAGSRTGRGAQDAPLDVVAGALIGRIGETAPFAIGDQTSFTAPQTGRLYLGVNDDHLADNRGQFEVMLTVQPRRTALR